MRGPVVAHLPDMRTAESTIRPVPERTRPLVPRQCTLNGFVEDVANTDGILVRDIEPLATLLARTDNSVYRIIPLEADTSRIMIHGGRFFPEPTEARLSGSGFGGSFLKLGWIGLGLRMEILRDGQRIITSGVREIQVQRPVSATARPS
jgi:hypothetical protein